MFFLQLCQESAIELWKQNKVAVKLNSVNTFQEI
jgi:hypothetical protein